MEQRKQVGIIGGTFNPIHLGHMILAEHAREYFELDEILFVPSGTSYMKEDVLDSKTRISMTGIAIEDNPYFALSTIEVDRGGNSYSYETMESLRADNPTTDYFFIVGGDSLFVIEKWMHPEKIFASCTIIAAAREGYSIVELKQQIQFLSEKYHANIQLLPTRCIDISSTDIRNKIRNNKSIRYLVHERVQHYIEKNKIYSDVEHD